MCLIFTTIKSSISEILECNRVDGMIHTHVSLISPKGKFQFDMWNCEPCDRWDWEGLNNFTILTRFNFIRH